MVNEILRQLPYEEEYVYACLKRGVTQFFLPRENIYWIYFPFEYILHQSQIQSIIDPDHF
jgi:hypothetical protein